MRPLQGRSEFSWLVATNILSLTGYALVRQFLKHKIIPRS